MGDKGPIVVLAALAVTLITAGVELAKEVTTDWVMHRNLRLPPLPEGYPHRPTVVEHLRVG